MVHRHSSVTEAYATLGISQGASLEVVKSTYKQLALKTHPDKNPGDADATAQFQLLSEAYNVLVKHLDRSSASSRQHSHTQFHPFGYSEDDYEDEEDSYYDEDVEYFDYDDDDDYDHDMAFYMYLFEELLNGRASRYSHAHYHRQHPHHHHHFYDNTPPESAEQYAARLRRAREEQEKAAERRAKEEAHRKAILETERELERRETEKRQRAKASVKKAEAEASRRNAEKKAYTQQQQLQALRSKVFAAARRKDAAAVKKGVWEDTIDAAGGEIRKGAEGLVKDALVDPRETLLHIAAKNGDLDLARWLDAHGAEPDERNGDDMTAFHVAVQGGYPGLVAYFLEAYSPEHEDYEAIYRSPESKSNLLLSLDAKDPEIVWMVLDKHLYTKEEIDQAWDVVNDYGFKSKISPPSKYEEFVNLFITFGGYHLYQQSTLEPDRSTIKSSDLQPRTDGREPRQQDGKYQPSPHPRPTVTVENSRSRTASPASAASEKPQTPTNSSRGLRGQYFRPGSYRPRQQESMSSPVTDRVLPRQEVPSGELPSHNRGRGRGRGRGQFRGRGRGRGQSSAGLSV